MSSISPNEVPGGGTLQGQQFYIPSRPAIGRHPLYRLYSAPGTDHMVSVMQGESGYQAEGILGYPFDSLVAGLCSIDRAYSGAPFDHRVTFCGETPIGYQKEGSVGYGFPRNGTAGELPIVVQGAQMKMVANKVAGGAISEVWWNNKQFINNWDFGRQLQIALNLELNGGAGEVNNPTEGGDRYGWPGVRSDPTWAHGSPLISSSVTGTKLSTTTRPLQWAPEQFTGGGPNNPVVWLGTIAKDVTLDYAGYANVARWDTKIELPSATNTFILEIATAYLLASFNRFYSYDAKNDGLTDTTAAVTNAAGSCGVWMQSIATGGVYLTTSDGAYAMGVYRNESISPGSHNKFTMCQFPGTDGKYGGGTSKWALSHYEPNTTTSAGWSTYTAYIVVGTAAQVKSTMRSLYLSGY